VVWTSQHRGKTYRYVQSSEGRLIPVTKYRNGIFEKDEEREEKREKAVRMQLAVARGELIEKALVQKQVAFLFVAMRQKMLAALLAYHRKLLACKDSRSMVEGITDMMHELLAELHDLPRKITDPNWIESLDED
jgi:hypothetical protein